jgi:hypothetical protein
MAELQPQQPSFVVRRDQPLIGIPDQEDGQEVTRYFADEAAADAATSASTIELALSAIGSWSDLDWDEMEEALDQIRHANPPTPLTTL